MIMRTTAPLEIKVSVDIQVLENDSTKGQDTVGKTTVYFN